MPSPASSPTIAPRLRTLRPAAVRAGLSQRVARATDALMAQAQPTAAGGAALAGRQGPMRLPRPGRRRLALLALAVVVVAIALTASGGPMAELTQAFERALHADWGWAAAAVAFEAASFAGYVVLFWLVAGGATTAIGARESAEISLSGAAATRLLPTGGLGGVALTLWALARAGLPARAAVRALLTFLVILYSVFMGALALAGLSLAAGIAHGDGPTIIAAVPALFGALVIIAALRLGRGGSGTAMGDAVRAAFGTVRRFDPRLLGAFAWWGFDLAVLAATFNALGTPPPLAVLVLAYFTGAIANTIPLPGLVAGGTTGVLLAFGVDASLALPAVLAYRAIALWLPAMLGALALAGLRRTTARWAAAPLPARAPTRARAGSTLVMLPARREPLTAASPPHADEGPPGHWRRSLRAAAWLAPAVRTAMRISSLDPGTRARNVCLGLRAPALRVPSHLISVCRHTLRHRGRPRAGAAQRVQPPTANLHRSRRPGF